MNNKPQIIKESVSFKNCSSEIESFPNLISYVLLETQPLLKKISAMNFTLKKFMNRIYLLNSTYTIFAVSSQKSIRNVTGFVRNSLHFFALYGIRKNASSATRMLKNKAEIISFYRADFFSPEVTGLIHILPLPYTWQHSSSKGLAPIVEHPETIVLFFSPSKFASRSN